MNVWAAKQKGFTIVELLIVIVVIAILAAITIVSYNGIQNRAKASAAQAAVSQAGKKVIAYAAQNNDMYPATLGDAGITNTDGLEYSYNNSSTPRTYGITATSSNVSYYMSNTVTSPAAGGYAGHSANGVATITNLATNPSFESTISGVSTLSGSVTLSNPTSGGSSGDRFLRATRTTTSGSWGAYWVAATVEPNTTYRVSLMARSNATASRNLNIEWISTSNSTISSPTIATTTPGSSWTAVTGTATSPSNADRLRITFYSTVAGTTSDYVDVDSVMITSGSTSYTFADGNSSGWAWDGTLNNSVSRGMPL